MPQRTVTVCARVWSDPRPCPIVGSTDEPPPGDPAPGPEERWEDTMETLIVVLVFVGYVAFTWLVLRLMPDSR